MKQWMCLITAAVETTMGSCLVGYSQEPSVQQGEVHFRPTDEEASVPEHWRLDEHTFEFQEKQLDDFAPGIKVSQLTFPSPVTTPFERNNTVHCEFYLPARDNGEKVPGVIVLHILGGDFPLARLCCAALAERGVAALFLKMPHYGPRREPRSGRRMVSKDPRETVESMTQAVLDIRRAVAWLQQNENVDGEQLGVLGISLGGITASLAASADSRLQNVCLLLAGGDMPRLGWESKELEEVRRRWIAEGKTPEEFFEVVKLIDPVNYAANVRGRHILMLNAKDDEVIPRPCTEALWHALGEPPITWYDGNHYTVARHFVELLNRTTDFFAPQQEVPELDGDEATEEAPAEALDQDKADRADQAEKPKPHAPRRQRARSAQPSKSR